MLVNSKIISMSSSNSAQVQINNSNDQDVEDGLNTAAACCQLTCGYSNFIFPAPDDAGDACFSIQPSTLGWNIFYSIL